MIQVWFTSYIFLYLRRNRLITVRYICLYIVDMWNTHPIRPYKNRIIPFGRPTLMYNLPYLYGAQRHACRVTDEQIGVCQTEFKTKTNFQCDETIFKLCCLLMEEPKYEVPSDPGENVHLYFFSTTFSPPAS